MNEQPTHLDLFSGIGGFSLAFEAEGFRTIGFSEIDPYASAVLRKHWPTVPNFGDITKLDGRAFRGKVDVLTGGFPCQPFSTAGNRRGKDDDRHLWPAMLKLIKSIKPAWVVGENVAGIISMELDAILSSLEKAGYQCQAFPIPALAVGAQHERVRIWIVAHRDSERELQPEGMLKTQRRRSCNKNQNVANGDGLGWNEAAIHNRITRQSRKKEPTRRLRVKPEQPQPFPPDGEPFESLLTPDTCGAPYGLPGGVDRIRCLGNAIVPQVAQVFARAIFQIHTGKTL